MREKEMGREEEKGTLDGTGEGKGREGVEAGSSPPAS